MLIRFDDIIIVVPVNMMPKMQIHKPINYALKLQNKKIFSQKTTNNNTILRCYMFIANSSVPSTPVIDPKKVPSFTQEQPHLDAYERALRQRKQEVSTPHRIITSFCLYSNRREY